jgi:ABC-2 type transport system permease protein
MSTPLNAMRDTTLDAPAVSGAAMVSPLRRIYWSVRRELWESRSIYLAPLAVAVLIVVGFLISMIRLPAKMRAVSALTMAQQHELIQQPYILAAVLLMGVSFIVVVFYCLDALHGERRDRSILFWKSLPVSDFTAVLAKASIPIVLVPLLTFAITVATQLIMLLLNAVVLLANGLSVTTLWANVSLFPMWVMLLDHLVLGHGLWFAPFYGWLLLASVWARRAAFLWAILPPLAIGVFEKIAFGTSHFAAMLQYRFTGSSAGSDSRTSGASMDVLTPVGSLNSLGFWIGLAVTAAFLAAAVRLRRSQGPI